MFRLKNAQQPKICVNFFFFGFLSADSQRSPNKKSGSQTASLTLFRFVSFSDGKITSNI
jgi:hypothetical protein